MFLKLFVISVAIWQVSSLRGGTLSSIGQFPSFVAIYLPTGNAVCGGAIISSNHVLTLANCMLLPTHVLLQTNQITIMSGHNMLDNSRPRAATHAIYVHPRYNPFTRENDIAVIRTVVAFTFPVVAQPPLAPGIISNRIAHDTLSCNIAAWNLDNIQQQTLTLPILNRDQCNDLPLNQGRVTQSQFCAGLVTSGSGVCEHNNGAILYCNGMIEGILHSGFGCGTANNPGIYVSTRHHNAWIQEQMRRQDIPLGGSMPLERLP